MVALGVDFGTSHTVAVARWPDGRVRPLLFDGSPLLPSAVFGPSDETALVVGRDAVHSARREPSQFEPNPKRRIDDGTVLLGERTVAVQDLLVAVFERVVTEFTRTAGGPPSAVTVTHPAGWAATRRKALADAVLAAGLPDAALVPEPVAAATYFVKVLKHMVPVGSAVVVYDLGAGTFDGSVVARTAEGFEVRSVGGRDDLGGLDFDEAVLTLIGRSVPAGDWRRLTAPATIEEARAARLLRDEAREAKERLSRTSAVTVLVPLLDLDVPLTREEFEAAARPLVERSVRVLTETVRLSKVTSDQLAGIFLVGGASQIPLVATELHRAFGRAPVMIEQPELVVAEGSVLVGPAVHPHRKGSAVVPAARSPQPHSGHVLKAQAGHAPPTHSGHVPQVQPGHTAPGLPGHAPYATGSPVPPVPASPAPPTSPSLPIPISPSGPISPVSPPAQRRPVSPPPMQGRPVSPGQMPPRPVPPMPMYPPPVYPQPVYPPPQVVYVQQPVYVPVMPMVPVVPPIPWRPPPGTIRWPAGFMTLYAVLLFIVLPFAAILAFIPRPATDPGTPAEWDAMQQDALTTAVLCVILGSLLIHGARRLRRGKNGHLWYPLGLCVLFAVVAVFNSYDQIAVQLMAVAFLTSSLLLLLPSARAWVRPPPKAPKPPKPPNNPPEPPPGEAAEGATG
ncbi:Hsp70 family protein [Dactylosporangium sp. AC04546]|uniref:Hsp70 family protein n=1 Tax=Dactylosporangium sp. AC04546 TaxID=2862460 RepID=UPI001EDFB9D2|nr:Hsp70 family protein [Dactylosporangium sp. AC04546]WVK85132.1 Hsp70 family protein [Dactylosporangium sp. AC04546]